MIRLKSLSIQNFKSFIEEQTIEFPTNGIWGINGRNLDTGGSSGSGKSSIAQAIAFALGYCKAPSTVLGNWKSEDPIKVVLKFECPEGLVEVTRKGTVLSLVVGGKKVPGNAAALQKKLSGLLGCGELPIKVLGDMTYRPQKSPGVFLHLTDTQKKEFLSDLLALGSFENQLKVSSEKVSSAQKILDNAQLLRDSFGPLPPEPSSPVLIDLQEQEVKRSIIIDQLAAANQTLEQSREQLNKIKRLHDKFLDEWAKDKKASSEQALAEIPHPTPIDFSQKEIFSKRIKLLREKILDNQTQHTKKIGELSEEVQAIKLSGLTLTNSIRQQILEISRLDKSIKSMESGVCPTCNQNWVQHELQLNELKNKLVLMSDSVQQLKNELIQNNQQEDLRSKELQHIKDNKPDNTVLEAAIESLTAKMANLEQNQKLLDSEYKLACQQKLDEVNNKFSAILDGAAKGLDQQSRDLRVKISELESLVKVLQVKLEFSTSSINGGVAANDSARRAYQIQKNFYDEAVKQKNILFKGWVEATKQLNEALDYQALIKGFVGAIFDDVLAEIAVEANQRLLSLPNVQGLTVAFESERQTASGGVRNEIKLVLRLDSQLVTFEALSGGQQSSCEMAIDRAWTEVAGRRTGLQPGWLVLDESFEGMDVVVKENCLEILREIAQDKLVLVIDHTSEFKQLFDGNIEVEFQNGVSRIRSDRDQTRAASAEVLGERILESNTRRGATRGIDRASISR